MSEVSLRNKQLDHINCAKRGVRDYLADAKGKGFYYLCVGWTMMVFAIVSGVSIRLLGISVFVPERPIWMFVYFASIIASAFFGIWWYHRRPRKDVLVISRDGIRWDLHLGRWSLLRDSGFVRFEDIDHLAFSSAWTEESCSRPSRRPELDSRESRQIAVFCEFVDNLFFPKGDLLLILKNGKKKAISHIMVRFTRESIYSFIAYLKQEHHELIG